jgi:multiple sugar transport system substrate-binding protein
VSIPSRVTPIKIKARRIIVSIVGVALALSACRSPVGGPSSDARISLRLSGWQSSPAEKQQLEQLIKNFEKSHPNITVRYEVINSEYMDVIRTRLIGDVAPDVFYLDALEAPALIKANVLQPLDRYIQPEFDLGDFEPNLLRAFQRDRTLYGIPKDFSTLALVYDTQAFQAARIAQPPRTWDDFRTVAKTLTTRPRFGFGLAPELARQTFVLKAFGGQLVNDQGYGVFANPAHLAGLQQVVDQYRQQRTAALPTDVGASSESEMLGRGTAAMIIDGPWTLPYLRQTFPQRAIATAPVPTVNGKPGTMAFTVAYVINRQSKHPDAAWTLISYLTSKASMQACGQSCLTLPARRSVLAELGYSRHPLYKAFVDGAAHATIWQAGETLPTIRIHFNNQFSSALLGQQPLNTAMQKAQDSANKEIYLAN